MAGELLGPLVGAGASLVGAGINALATGRMNKKTMDYNREMYWRQRQDSLVDWNRQNEYNAPQAQMARLVKAGLNPQLVYGQGAVGNAASAPDTPHAMPYRAEAPNLGGIAEVPERYFNIKTQQQILSNQKQQGNLLALDALIKTEDARSKNLMNNYMSQYGYGYKKGIEGNTSNLIYQKLLAQASLNAFNFGDTNKMGEIADGSAYSLQAKGMRLLNDLRSGQKRMQGLQNVEQSIRNKYLKRTMSGELKDMSAKDWIQSLIGAGSVLKR